MKIVVMCAYSPVRNFEDSSYEKRTGTECFPMMLSYRCVVHAAVCNYSSTIISITEKPVRRCTQGSRYYRVDT